MALLTVDFCVRGPAAGPGNLSPAGGIKVIRYGMSRDWVARLKVVNRKGRCLDLNKTGKEQHGLRPSHFVIRCEGLGFIPSHHEAVTQPRILSVRAGLKRFGSTMDVLTFPSKAGLTALQFFSHQR